jgi:putative inorganic carbon (hco3(-)) transporter
MNNMKKQRSKQLDSNTRVPLNISYILIVVAYCLLAAIAPNSGAVDSNGPEFLSLSVLNLGAFIFLLRSKAARATTACYANLFRTRLGVVYLLFMLLALLSFTQAFNVFESILEFAKLFTVFSAAYILSIIFRVDRRCFRYALAALITLLFVDCCSVFNYVGSGVSPSEMKFVYSNKNILAAAIFIKLPAVLWLLSFAKGVLRKLGYVLLFVAVLALLFLSTRAFYLGVIFLFVLYAVFLLTLYFRTREKKQLFLLVKCLGIILSAVLVFNTAVYLMSLNKKGSAETDLATRLATVRVDDASAHARLSVWQDSFSIIKDHPVLGVGVGNWKIYSLKYQNLVMPGFAYLNRCHNDFIQTTADIGILGGLLFVGIFLLVFSGFLLVFFKKEAVGSSYSFMFVPTFGLACYSVDAFFNFPSDRPAIAMLFALYVGAAISFFSSALPEQDRKGNKFLLMGTKMVFIVMMVGSIYALIQNYKSLKLQAIVYSEALKEVYSHRSDEFVGQFPSIPAISMVTASISVYPAEYLIREGKFEQALKLLKADHSNPYDSRNDNYIARAYIGLNQTDSALLYCRKANAKKPLCFALVDALVVQLAIKGKLTEVLQVLDKYVLLMRRNGYVPEVGVYERRAYCYFALKDYPKCMTSIHQAFTRGCKKPEFLNLRGVCYFNQQNMKAAYKDFELASSLGDAVAIKNLKLFSSRP